MLEAQSSFWEVRASPPPSARPRFSDGKPEHRGGGQGGLEELDDQARPGTSCLPRPSPLARQPPPRAATPRAPGLRQRGPLAALPTSHRSSRQTQASDPGAGPLRRQGEGRGRRREPGARSGRRRRGSGVGRRLPRAAVGGLFRGEEPGLGRLGPRHRLPLASAPSLPPPAPRSAPSPRPSRRAFGLAALPSPSRTQYSRWLPRPAPRSRPRARHAHPVRPRPARPPPGNPPAEPARALRGRPAARAAAPGRLRAQSPPPTRSPPPLPKTRTSKAGAPGGRLQSRSVPTRGRRPSYFWARFLVGEAKGSSPRAQRKKQVPTG